MSNETWDYMAAAASDYLAVVQSNEAEETEPTAFAYPIAHFLSRVAADSAVEYSRLLEGGVPPEHARMSVQLTLDHHYAMMAAREIIPHDYAEWRREAAFVQAYPNPVRDEL